VDAFEKLLCLGKTFFGEQLPFPWFNIKQLPSSWIGWESKKNVG
jgi:hypothetical protein